MTSTFLDYFKAGRFVAARKWEDLDKLWESLRQSSNQDWYVYAVGEAPPTTPVKPEKLEVFITEIDGLLRREHEEDYCGIVYADDHQNPTLIKVFDPNNLGMVCGSSDNPPLPGWVISTMAPANLSDAFPQPGNRKRWWQKIFPA